MVISVWFSVFLFVCFLRELNGMNYQNFGEMIVTAAG